jgi:pilus assembly protein CpaB
MAGLAVTFGAVSYFAGNRWLENQAQAIESQRSDGPAIEMSTVVVAAEQLRFGQTISEDKLKEVPWPKEALPEGAFSNISELTGEKGERKAIKTIETGEPILAVKITGKNGHAGLAGVIADGMRAVTIPVDLATGVGGFVMPGDRVDIVLTKKDRENGEQVAKIIMENVKVLSIDQDADRASDGPKVAKSVTLETDAQGAQRLALANTIGRLSLLLRSAGDEIQVGAAALTGDDLDGKPKKADTEGFLSFLKGNEKKTVADIKVVRRDQVTSHLVPVDEELQNLKNQ